jgi:hypothetical protein
MAISASTIGSFFTTLPILKDEALTNILDTLIITITGSLLVIIFISVLRRFKESQQEVTISNRSQKIENAINFEKAVGKLILKKNYDIHPSKLNENYDFLVNHKDGKILIEVKTWSDRVPTSLVERTALRLKSSVESEKAREGIIVIQNPIRNKGEFSKESQVKILTKEELNKYL